jgi:transcription elongation GreA/GreB family factor
MQQPPDDILAAILEARTLWRAAVNTEDRVAEQYAMRRLDEALDAWNTRLRRAA